MKSLELFIDKVKGKLLGILKYIGSFETKKYICNKKVLSNLTSACNKIIQMDNITSKDEEMTTKYLINELENFIKIKIHQN